jgi:hypothetical protein
MHVGEVRFLSRFSAAAVTGLLLFAFGVGAARAEAATITVDSTANTTGLAGCTLHDAIASANTGTAPGLSTCASGGDTINFTLPGSAPWTIDLSLLALPAVTGALTIQGPGAQSLTLLGGNGTVGNGVRILATYQFTTPTLAVSNLVLKQGNADADPSGNGGGAIYNPSGTVTLNSVALTGNHADNVSTGGAITNNATMTIQNSTLTANRSDTNSGGGAIRNFGTLTIKGSTLTGNHSDASSGGGGIANTGTLTVENSTLTGNHANDGNGGAIYINAGTLSIKDSTITGNNADTGGGISAAATVTLADTILAGNTAAGNPDCNGGLTSQGYNLVGISDSAGCTWTPAAGDQLGTSATPINPLLGPLQDNGGLTSTMAPTVNSPAVDKGTAAGLLNDQRSFARTFDMNPASATGGDGTDIGAFEQQIAVNPATTMPFGSQQWGTTSSPDTAFLRNRTGNDFTSGSSALGGTNPGDFQLGGDSCSNATLGNNSICGVNVAFAPISAGNGARAATLLLPTDVAPTLSLALTGSVTEFVSIAPAPHDFGSTQTGTPTGATQFTVTNAGPGTSGTLGVATLTGANASEFGITQDNCSGQTLTPPTTCTVFVRMAPTSAGNKAASLNIAVTGTPGATTSAALTGTATTPSPPAPPAPPAAAGPTGQRAAALKKCKKKKTAKARKKCKKKANKLPV